MKLKLTKDGHAVVKNGMPVYVHANGREEEFDAPAAMKLAVGKHFQMSKAAGGLKIPPDLAAAFFGDSFRIERGQLVAYAGDVKMYSNTRHGEPADFEEALGQLIERYPNKAMILRETGAAGVPHAAGQQQAGAAVSRAAFDAMPQDTRARFLKDGGRIGDAAGAPTPAAPPVAGAGKSVTRAVFDVMGTQERGAHFKAGGKVVD